MSMSAPVEAKVTAASGTALVVGFIVSWLGTAVFHGTVPDAVVGVIDAAVTAGAAFVAGWLTKHTSRPGDNPPTA
jgi:hypothetical protein